MREGDASAPTSVPPLNTVIDEAIVMTDGSEDHKLAHDIIEVHGTEAATVARENARAAALAGQAERAKAWIRVLENIQRQQSGKASTIRNIGDSSSHSAAFEEQNTPI